MIRRPAGVGVALAMTLFAGAALGAATIKWTSQRVELPAPGPFFSGQGADALNANCIVCHSADFVNSQPNLPLATWKAEVLKMKNVFHAPVQDSDVDTLAQILFARNPAPAK